MACPVKAYRVKYYNTRLQYCGWSFMIISRGERIEDLIDIHDRATPIRLSEMRVPQSGIGSRRAWTRTFRHYYTSAARRQIGLESASCK